MTDINGLEIKTEYKHDNKKGKLERTILPIALVGLAALVSLLAPNYTPYPNSKASNYSQTKEVKIYGSEGFRKALDENIPAGMRAEKGFYSELLKLNPALMENLMSGSTATIKIPVYSEEKK